MLKNNKMSQLVIISANWPEFDATAAGLRMYELIDLFLDQGYQIHYATTAALNEFHRDALNNKGIETHSIELNSDTFDDFLKELSPEVVLFDRYVVEEQFGWRVSETLPNAVKILDTEDLHSLRVSRQLAHRENTPWNVDYWKAQDITKRELSSMYRSDLNIIISSDEMNYLKEVFEFPEQLLSYLPFTPTLKESQNLSYTERKDLVFIGNGMHAPNRDAVDFLKKEIWPIVRKELKEVKLHIYGAYLPQSVLNYHQPKEGFLVHGKAKNASEVISKARINLAPLRYGAGVKGKVIEGILCKTPTVCTSIATEGIDGLSPIATDAGSIAQRIVELYKDENQWMQEVNLYTSIASQLVDTKEYICTFKTQLNEIRTNLRQHRSTNYIGQLFNYESNKSTKYFSKWIEEKNKRS